MIRALSLAALLAAGLSIPALAADEAAAPATDAAAVSAFTSQLSAAANAEQVRKLLQAQGYSNISDLALDDKGRWTGSAVKDGKSVGVAIALPPKGTEAPAKN